MLIFASFTKKICYLWYNKAIINFNYKPMNKNILWSIIILIVIGAGIYLTLGQEIATAPESQLNENAQAESEETPAEKTVKEFTVTGSNFAFDPSEIRVNQGDTVKINFINSMGTHDWKVEGYEAGTQVLQNGQSQTIEFVADKAGTFEFYCSVGQHRANGMRGNLIVE
jgi:plastocyanin